MPIRPDSPCQEDWASFEARPHGRHCGSCDVTVVDLTRVTRKRAETMVKEAGGRLCGRLRVGHDGEPVFAPETRRAPGLLGVAVGLLAAACDSSPEPGVETAPVAVTPTPTLLVSAHTGGSLMSTERVPMRPLSDEPTAVEAARAPVAVVDDEPVPTPEQLLLTEAKEEREREASRPRRHRRSTATASIAGTRVHPLPAIPSPQTLPEPDIYLGGISYDP